MESCLTADLLRSLSLFITYAIHKSREPSRLQKKKSLRFNSGVRQPTNSGEPKYVSSTVIATEMLRMYCSLLCNTHDFGPIKKFARAVTNKVRSRHLLMTYDCVTSPDFIVVALVSHV